MTPAEQRQLAGIQAELGRVARYDDESVVNDKWVRQRYDCGCFASFAPARTKSRWMRSTRLVCSGSNPDSARRRWMSSMRAMAELLPILCGKRT